MIEYWIVTENKTGRVIAHCGDINDAMMMVSFDPSNRSYKRNRILLDQVIDVTSTTDKQLPTSAVVGGNWTPESSTGNGPGPLPQIKLPEGEGVPVVV